LLVCKFYCVDEPADGVEGEERMSDEVDDEIGSKVFHRISE